MPLNFHAQDVDLVLKSGRPPPKSIKEMLKKKFGNKYDTRQDGFYYTLAPGKQINIDVIDGGMVRPSITSLSL